jgi:hypothetical protein
VTGIPAARATSRASLKTAFEKSAAGIRLEGTQQDFGHIGLDTVVRCIFHISPDGKTPGSENRKKIVLVN